MSVSVRIEVEDSLTGDVKIIGFKAEKFDDKDFANFVKDRKKCKYAKNNIYKDWWIVN